MAPRGYSLAEVTVAVTILAVGVLAAAASAVPVARLVRWGGVVSASAAIAGAQLEAMRAAGCGTLEDGTAPSSAGYRVSWTVVARGALREVTVSVGFPTGSGSRSESYEALIACRP
jgi:prepilin-type N-terminal cleavage/methylation domain-containing protein